jgi:hypothetical protein
MKPLTRGILIAQFLGVVSVIGSIPGNSQVALGQCTLATLNGQYMVAANGTLFPPQFGVTETSVTAAAGYSVYNGDGTGTDYVTLTINGVNANVTSPTATSYTLGADCTGTKTVLPPGPTFNIFVADNGEILTAVSTLPQFAVSEYDRRVLGSR